MSDEEIRIRALFDAGQFTAGVQAAVGTTQQGASQMGAAFVAANNQATTTTNATTVATQNLSNQLNVLNATLKTVQTTGGGALIPLNREFTGTQFAIHGVAQELGINLPRETARWIASLQGVPQLMAAAFNIIGIVGIIEIIPLAINAFEKLIAEIVGFGEAQKKAAEKFVADNLAMIQSNIRLKESYREVALIGQEGSTKTAGKIGDLKNETKDLGAAMAEEAKSVRGMQTEVNHLTKGWSGAKEGLLGYFDGSNDKIERDRKSIELFTGSIDKFQDAWKQVKLESTQAAAELIAQQLQEARTIAESQLNAIKAVGEARVKVAEDTTRRAYEISKITLQEETKELIDEENKKYAVLVAANARKLALAHSDPDHAQGTAKAIEIGGESTSAAIEHANALKAIAQKGAEEQKRIDNQAAEATIAATKEVGDARVALSDSAANELYASEKISAKTLTDDLVQNEEKRTANVRKALQDRLAIAQQDAQKNASQIITLNGQLQTIEITSQQKINEIRAEGDRRELAAAKKSLEEEIRAAEEAANRQLEAAEKLNNLLLKGHRETNKQWHDNEIAALNTWYAASAAALNKELAEAKRIYGEDGAAYKALIDKKKALDQEYHAKVLQTNIQEENSALQAYLKIAEGFNQAFLKMLNRQESFQKGFEQAWDHMVLGMIDNILKGAEQYALSLVMQEATAEKSILISAKDAAAKAWSSAPNPIVGALEAAGTFAAVLAYGSFDRGGIVPNDGFHQLHRKEMVLPAGLSTGLQRAIGKGQLGGYSDDRSTASRSSAGSKSESRSGAPHLTYSPTINAYDRNGMKQTLQSHKDDILDIVRAGYKSGGLG
jgi:hypothetical protein